MFIVLLFWCGDLLAQQEDSIFQALQQQAQTAYQNKEYIKSIELYLKAADHPAGKQWRGGILYNVSCDYSLLGNIEKALEYLQLAIDAGYTDYRWMGKDTDFDFLRRADSARFSRMLTLAREVEQNDRLMKSPIAIIEYDTYIGPQDFSKHVWDDFHHPMMDSLSKMYNLAGIVKSGKNEFEKMKLMLDWVATRWVHDGNNTCKEQNALAILAAAGRGERFACVDYTTVLTQGFIALGFPARSIGILKFGAAYGNGKGHRCTEVWSNQYQKWILFDGQNNAWWEVNGVPLNANECRHMMITGKKTELKFVGQYNNIDYTALKTEWSEYFYRYWFPYDNRFFDKTSFARERSCELITDNVIPELYSTGFSFNISYTDNPFEAYPSLNQTNIRLKTRSGDIPTDTLDIILSHTMPFFRKFLIQLNGNGWKESSDKFPWILKKGMNTIEARAVNLANILGKVSRIILKNNIGISTK